MSFKERSKKAVAKAMSSNLLTNSICFLIIFKYFSACASQDFNSFIAFRFCLSTVGSIGLEKDTNGFLLTSLFLFN